MEKAERDRIGQMDYAIKQGREEGREEPDTLLQLLVSNCKLGRVGKLSTA